MTDLRDLMSTMLLDEPTLPLVVDAAIRDGRRARRRHRVAAAASTCLVVAVVASVGVVIARTSADSPSQVSSGTTAARCDTPTRVVPGFVDWPCVTPVPSHYEQLQIQQTFQQGVTLWPTTVVETDLQMRVLGFGPLPNSRPDTSLVYAEVWQRTGSTAARMVATVAAPIHDYGKRAVRNAEQHGVNPRDPLAAVGASGPMPQGDPGLYINLEVGFRHPEPKNACQTMERNLRPRPHYPTACTDTVIARQDITQIRTVDPGGRADAPLAVTSGGLAGLPYTDQYRHGWHIQGLDSSGDVVTTVPYRLSR